MPKLHSTWLPEGFLLWAEFGSRVLRPTFWSKKQIWCTLWPEKTGPKFYHPLEDFQIHFSFQAALFDAIDELLAASEWGRCKLAIEILSFREVEVSQGISQEVGKSGSSKRVNRRTKLIWRECKEATRYLEDGINIINIFQPLIQKVSVFLTRLKITKFYWLFFTRLFFW